MQQQESAFIPVDPRLRPAVWELEARRQISPSWGGRAGPGRVGQGTAGQGRAGQLEMRANTPHCCVTGMQRRNFTLGPSGAGAGAGQRMGPWVGEGKGCLEKLDSSNSPHCHQPDPDDVSAQEVAKERKAIETLREIIHHFSIPVVKGCGAPSSNIRTRKKNDENDSDANRWRFEADARV